ncbi:MAG: ribonuclease Z [Clostridia bacterium]|nr:ribonuclease Z [Clostridia bacterium]
MKITFLGTSHGVPSAERHCSCAMIEAGDAIYFIDAGASIIEELLKRKKDISKVRCLFTTHGHGDHIYGIIQFTDLINWYYTNYSINVYFTEQRVNDAVNNLIFATSGSKVKESRIKFITVDKDFVYEDENIRLSLIPNMHLGTTRPSYGILVESEGKRILFSGDLSKGLKDKDFPAILAEESIDAFVCELAHFGISDMLPYLDTCKAKSVYFTHVEPASKFEDIKAISNNYDFSVNILSDSDEIVL